MDKNKRTLAVDGVEFKTHLPIQIRFSDIDALGHINNNIYFSFFDLAKVDYFDRIRGSVSWTEGTIVIAHLEVDYLSSVFYKEKVTVDSKIIKIGNKSGQFLQQLRNEKTGEIKCICTSTFVYLDTSTHKPAPIPFVWREAIEKYEGVKFEQKEKAPVL